jgi:hypothetical protein
LLSSADDVAERLKKRLASGWSEDKVRALSNEAILERLVGSGIVTSEDEFVELARAEHSADAVAEDCRRSYACVSNVTPPGGLSVTANASQGTAPRARRRRP